MKVAFTHMMRNQVQKKQFEEGSRHRRDFTYIHAINAYNAQKLSHQDRMILGLVRKIKKQEEHITTLTALYFMLLIGLLTLWVLII